MKLRPIHHTWIFNKTKEMFSTFFRDEAIGGRLIIMAAVLAIVVVNSPLDVIYHDFWHTVVTIGTGKWAVSQSLLHWLNEGLMGVFFFVVGLEIRRELENGELRSPKNAVLPIGAAIGGMVVPAVIYLAINYSHPSNIGWGIPMATDIAIAVGVLSLVGKHIPRTLKVFLLTLAIVDDIGAVIVIALFYSSHIEIFPLIISLIVVLIGILLRMVHHVQVPMFLIYGGVLWYFVYQSGVVPSIIGVILAMIVPMSERRNRKYSTGESLERISLPVSTFLIVPLFAFANAGIIFSRSALQAENAMLVAWGIFLGLFAGKVIGITGVSWLLIKLKLGRLPHYMSMPYVIGVGFLAGIGCTISIYITGLAFDETSPLITVAKMSILAASIVSGVVGLIILKRAKTPVPSSAE